MELEHAIHDKARLLMLVADGDEPGILAAQAPRPEVLREPFRRARDDGDVAALSLHAQKPRAAFGHREHGSARDEHDLLSRAEKPGRCAGTNPSAERANQCARTLR